MVYVVGASVALPQCRIADAFLTGPLGLSSHLKGTSQITSRATLLPLDYLLSTKNSDPGQSRSRATETSVALGKRACLQVLEQSQLLITQLGFIIADTSNPYEVIPAESQRVAAQLGLKIPCFDIITAGVSYPNLLTSLNNWQVDKLPDYSIALSIYTPTLGIDYAHGDAAFLLGDAATALLISTKEARGFKLLSNKVLPGSGKGGSIEIPTNSPIKIDRLFKTEILPEKVKILLSSARQELASAARVFICGSDLGLGVIEKTIKDLDLSGWEQISLQNEIGDSLGTAPAVVLAQNWERFKSGDLVVLLSAGCGAQSGYSVLQKV